MSTQHTPRNEQPGQSQPTGPGVGRQSAQPGGVNPAGRVGQPGATSQPGGSSQSRGGSQSGSEEHRHEFAERVARRGHEAVDSAADRVDSAQDRFEDARERAGEVSEKAKENLTTYTDKAERYMRENPVAAAGIAFAAGVIVSSLLRR